MDPPPHDAPADRRLHRANRRQPGAGRLRQALGADVTLSALEDGFSTCSPQPGCRDRARTSTGGDKVDRHWPELGLTLELVS